MRTLLILITLLLSNDPVLAAQPAFDPISMEPVHNIEFPPGIEELTFESKGHRLSGLIYLANGPGPHPTVVLLHGFPGNEKNLDIAQVLRRAGFNVMFFHYRGAWGSEGDYQVLKGYEDALTALDRVVNYADSLFMLHGFSGNAMRQQMKSASMAEVDTTTFGPGLRGKSVFMVVGEQDKVTPATIMFNPVVAAYSTDEKIKLQHHIISGDHSFSWSRLHLTRLVLAWMEEDCR